MISALSQNLKVVGGYDLLEKLGEGGMGAVYKARKHGSEELVAVKIMPPDTGNTTIRRRFEQEFRAARRLDHPNIVKVLDQGDDQGYRYLVMELVPGKSFAEVIRGLGRLPESQAVEIILKVATALQQVHALNLVHRDVKPDNILLAPGGVVKLTDLGLVKVLDDDIDLTQLNSGLGTPNYMAPEQFNNAKHADPGFDIYSLGATLYTAVTGEIPFRASTPLAVLKKKFTCELAPPRVLAPALSERLERTILRAMSLDPAQRHASCSEFIDDLTGKPSRKSSRRSSGTIRVIGPAGSKHSGKEQRRHARFPCSRPGRCLPVAGHPDDQWTAIINDVSLSGVGLTVNRRFEVGTVMQLQLHDRPKGAPQYLLVRVVRQQQQGKSPRRWVLGCVFAAPIDKEELEVLL
jgi:serine/threonine protein kinase